MIFEFPYDIAYDNIKESLLITSCKKHSSLTWLSGTDTYAVFERAIERDASCHCLAFFFDKSLSLCGTISVSHDEFPIIESFLKFFISIDADSIVFSHFSITLQEIGLDIIESFHDFVCTFFYLD